MMAKTWKQQLEETKQRCILTLQRAYRARRSARAAKVHADGLVAEKRIERKARDKERRRLEQKQHEDFEEAERLKWMNATEEERMQYEADKRRREGEMMEKRVRRAMQSDIKRASANRRLLKRLILSWRAKARHTKMKRKKHVAVIERRWQLWRGYTLVRRRMRVTWVEATTTIQAGMYRGPLGRQLAAERRAMFERIKALVRRRFRGLELAHFRAWGVYYKKMAALRQKLKRRMAGTKERCFLAWSEVVRGDFKLKKEAVAVIQAFWRKIMAMHAIKNIRKIHRAANCVQRFIRTMLAKTMARRARRHKEEDQAKIRFMLGRLSDDLVLFTFRAWKMETEKMRKVRRIFGAHERKMKRTHLRAWLAEVFSTHDRRVASATMMQNLWRSKCARRVFANAALFYKMSERIQKCFRARRERDTLAWLRTYQWGATKIQCFVRAYECRHVYVRSAWRRSWASRSTRTTRRAHGRGGEGRAMWSTRRGTRC